MRRGWITLAVLVLLAGLAVGYLRDRRDPPDDAPPAGTPTPAAPVEPPERPPVHQDTHPAEARAASPLESFAERAGTVEQAPVSEPPATSLGAAPPPAPASAPAPAPAPIASPSALVTHQPGAQVTPPVAAPPVPLPIDPDSDRHPPVLKSLRFDPPEIQNGGTAILTIEATDDLSGVRSAVGTVRGPSEAAVVPFVAREAGGNGVFTATIAISHQAEAGYWFVSALQLVDKADNPTRVSFTKTTVPGGGALHVVSEESDSKAPEVHRVFIEKGAVSGGEKNRITIDVDDDGSGVESVAGTFRSPSKSAFIPFACVSSGEGSWTGEVPVPANADCGAWTLWQLRVADKANNRSVLAVDSPQLERATFVVSGGGTCDSDPPVLDTLFISPEIVSNGASADVVLTVTAHDDGGNVVAMTGRVEGPASANGRPPSIFFSAPPGPKTADAPIVVRITVPQHAAQGIWRVALLELTDLSRNARSYHVNDPALATAFFTVE